MNVLPLDWVVSPSCQITFFCKNCGDVEHRHLDGKCLFNSTMFAYERRAVIAKRLAEDRFVGTQAKPEEVAAFLKAIVEDLKRMRIPGDPP